MKKAILFCIPFIILAVSNLAAQDVEGVDREELERNIREVEFINYMGPHTVIESRSAIMSIGSGLANIISDGNMQASASGGRYRVLHLVDPTEPDKIGADIFIIEADARVDHIRNLRLIIAAYLSGMYGYNNQDAMFIAELVTLYNAIYRGNLEYFGSVFINKVMVNLSRENAGIDVHFSNWPGKTRLVIPLRSMAGGAAGRPDLFVLADSEVIEDLRSEDDMGIDQRKRIVELQEESVEEERRLLEEREEAIARRDDEAAEREAAITQREQELRQRQEAGDIIEEQANEEQRRLDAERAALEEERERLEAEREAAEAQRREIEQREDEIAEARELIAEDSNVLRDRDSDADADAARDESIIAGLAAARRAPFLMIEGGRDLSGRFIFYDIAEERALIPEDAPITGARLFLDIPAGYVLPVRNERGNFVLAILSKEDLAPVLRSNEEIHGQTFLLFLDNKIYCVVRQGGRFVIGRYSTELRLEASSDIEALPDTFITSSGNFILFQNREGVIAVVDRNTLRPVSN
ncbi:MAG: hypothetical protein FWD87_09755 [Spirochaetaceae bacterium]|nr:hypothetical protein [Spirochaetaceae bacterium]